MCLPWMRLWWRCLVPRVEVTAAPCHPEKSLSVMGMEKLVLLFGGNVCWRQPHFHNAEVRRLKGATAGALGIPSPFLMGLSLVEKLGAL